RHLELSGGSAPLGAHQRRRSMPLRGEKSWKEPHCRDCGARAVGVRKRPYDGVVRIAWVPLLLLPAAVVFVVARTTVDPIAGAEHVHIPRIAASIPLPGLAVAGTGVVAPPFVHIPTKPASQPAS